jgi:transposase-like protein
MIPLDVFGSESLAADLLEQVRWRDGVECPRCRSDRTVKNGSYGAFQRYLCKNCDRTFNDKTGTIFAHSKVALRKWLFSIYAFLRFNTSLRQLQREIGVAYKARARGLSTRGRGSYEGDKPPVFTIVDRGTGQRYVVPAKSADESTVRLLLADHEEESLTVYTDGFRAYDPLEDDDEFHREYVVHGDGEYADGDIHVNTCESHASLVRRWLSPHRGVSKDKLTQYLRAFQLRSELFRKPGREALKHAVKATL